MDHLPLPSHVHYELMLQLLERKAITLAYDEPNVREKLQQLIITLRKALAQQKQLEAICDQIHLPVEHRWGLNSIDAITNGKVSLNNDSVNSNS